MLIPYQYNKMAAGATVIDPNRAIYGMRGVFTFLRNGGCNQSAMTMSSRYLVSSAVSRMEVSSAGLAINTTVNYGASVFVRNGGTVSSTVVNSNGNVQVSSGGAAKDTELNYNAQLHVSPGASASGGNVHSYGRVYASSNTSIFCNHYAAFMANWAKEISWKSVAEHFRTSWQTVSSAVEWVVDYGLSRRKIDMVEALGVDEIAWHKGHSYLTLVYQIDPGAYRLLWIGEQRTQATMESFFKDMAALKSDFSEQIKVICSDMWKPYLKVIARHLPKAINILDRFHIMQKFGRALDKVRTEEAKRLRKEKQQPILAKSRWCFLKRKENLTEKQSFKLKELLKMNLRTVKAYLLREQFQKLWNYRSPGWAGRFLDQWCHAATCSRIEPMKDIAKMLTVHRTLILNFFRAKKQFNSSIVEGLNRKIILIRLLT